MRAAYMVRRELLYANRQGVHGVAPWRICRLYADTVPHGADGAGPGVVPAPLRAR